MPGSIPEHVAEFPGPSNFTASFCEKKVSKNPQMYPASTRTVTQKILSKKDSAQDFKKKKVCLKRCGLRV